MNIDKDIEILKEIAESIRFDGDIYLKETDKQAIENVLSELETNKKAVDNLLVKNAELREELETYKKMVKKLVERIIERMKDESSLDGNCYEEFGVTFCQRANDDCNKCIIDWARKEVEKDDN